MLHYSYIGVKVKEVYKQFNPKLVQSLPLKDPLFNAQLTQKNLFYGNLREKVMSPAFTRADAATHFLYNAIERSLDIGDRVPFDSLLQVMENFDNLTLNKLAREIRQELTTKVSLSTS